MHRLQLLIDMIHDNPGEEPFDTKFRDPRVLADYGFNGQAGKNIQSVVEFDSLGMDVFPRGTAARAWIDKKKTRFKEQMSKTKAAGLMSFHHIDLFVFPTTIVKQYSDDMMNAEGKIDIDRPKTLELCEVLFDELFAEFPELDGLIVRVGETYLHDTPYHVGNAAVAYTGYPLKEQQKFVKLIMFLRRVICEKYNKYLIYRTWDTHPDKFHANPEYYLAITNQIETHPKLIFSIKHTALDFWQAVRFNPCILQGKHRQIIEIQCQREYEGKGAHPNYVIQGILEGFEENSRPVGLREVAENPQMAGIYLWSRGGGWFGPYIKNEFWCDLHVFTLSRWFHNPRLSEKELFRIFCQRHQLDPESMENLHRLCLLSRQAILKGRYCRAYDSHLEEKVMPVNNWLRDDHIPGFSRLDPVFEHLYKKGLLQEALLEKSQARALWQEVDDLAARVKFPDKELQDFFEVSVKYGKLLYEIICIGWEILTWGYQGDQTGTHSREILQRLMPQYDQAWKNYRTLLENPLCSSLYQTTRRVAEYAKNAKTMNGDDTRVVSVQSGMDYSVDKYRRLLALRKTRVVDAEQLYDNKDKILRMNNISLP
jgi:hypothetical protein